MTLLNPTGQQPAADESSVGRHAAPASASPGSALRGRWPFAAFVAGPAVLVFPALGQKVFGHEVSDQGPMAVYEQVRDLGTQTHVGLVLAFVGAIALALFAQGFVRFLDARTPAGSGAASLARIGVTSAVGLAVLIASMKAVYRGGLPDHGDSAMYPKESVADLYTLVDQLQYVSLWPLTFTMAAVVVLWFVHRTLPRWYGILSGVLVVATVLMALVLGLPYFAGIVGPLWLVASGVVVLRHRGRPVGLAA